MVYRKPGEHDIDDNNFIVNFDEIFPRRHPSAQLALNLGWVSVMFGALAGIPAIMLARLVLREIAESDGRYHGGELAQRGEQLGTVGTYLTGMVALFVLSYWWPVAIVAGIGIAITGAAIALATRDASHDRPLAALGQRLRQGVGAMALGGVIAASVGGFVKGRQAEETARLEAIAQCDALLRDAELAIAANTFAQAKSNLETSRASCLGAQIEKLKQARADFDTKETAYNARIEKEAAERRAKAEREVAEARLRAFEGALQDAAKALKDASDTAARGKWIDANAHTDRASKSLQDVAWPEFVEEKRWVDATKQVDALRKRIAVPLEQLRKAEESARARKAAAEDAAKKQVEAAEEAREASKHLLCNDGTRSPSCLCNRANRRGCCSRHGGVAGCE